MRTFFLTSSFPGGPLGGSLLFLFPRSFPFCGPRNPTLPPDPRGNSPFRKFIGPVMDPSTDVSSPVGLSFGKDEQLLDAFGLLCTAEPISPPTHPRPWWFPPQQGSVSVVMRLEKLPPSSDFGSTTAAFLGYRRAPPIHFDFLRRPLRRLSQFF